MKSKKSNAPGCFAGGDITSVVSALGSLAGNYAGAFNYKGNPTGDPYQINLAAGLQGGLIGMIPEIVKYQKDRKQRAEYVPAATPGRYAMGGDINDNSIPSQQSYTTNARQKAVGKGIESSGRKIWKRGMKEDGSGELTNMQQFLKNKGFYSGDVNGIYGAKTEEAVRKYQKWFNENSTEEMTYTTDGTNAERIGGKGGKRIKVDGIVGDQTRTALMYREMPKQTSNKKPMPENVEFPVGQGVNKFKTTDYTPTDFPDSPMNYAGGLEMLGWALAGMQAGGAGIGLLEGELAGVNAARNLTQQGLQKITTTRPPLNPNVPNPLNGIGGRSFAPKTPSSYGTRIGYAMGGEMQNGGPDDPPRNDVPLDVLQVLDMINLKTKAARGLNALKKGLPLAGLAQTGYYMSEGNNMRAAANIVPFLPDLVDEVAPGWDSKEHNQRLANAASALPKAWETYKSKVGLAYGGEMDEQLSSRAFEVEANPNKIDSKHYPNLGVKLDHGEVVTDNKFVFSNRIKNPQTGKSFAEDAEKLQKSVGKSEKVMKTNPRDAFANNTIALSNNRTSKLASAQETLATLLGHRESSPKGMATGGYTGGPDDPIYRFLGETDTKDIGKFTNISPKGWLDFTNPYDPATGQRRRPLTPDSFVGSVLEKNQALIDLGRDGLFYDPYTNRFAVRNSKGRYVGVAPSQGQFNVADGVITDLKNNKTFSIKQHLDYLKTPKIQSTGSDGPTLQSPANILPNPQDIYPDTKSKLDPLNPFPLPNQQSPSPPIKPRAGGGKGKPSTANTKQTTSPLDGQVDYDRAMYEEMQKAANNNLPAFREGYNTPTSVASTTERGLPNIAAASNFGTTPTGVSMGEDKLFNKFTAGDALQALEVASKFGQLVGGPDKEMPNFDTTRITKETFDPTNAFYQTNRTFQNALNTIDAPSINLRRNIANSLYAQRLGQDNNTRSEYNRMNQSANTAYEQRVSDQRRYNIGQTNYTEDLNQRNLDTYRNAVQNAFTSLGNFGEGMNQKKQGTDALNILKKSYPQVYQRIMEAWLQEEQSKTNKS